MAVSDSTATTVQSVLHASFTFYPEKLLSFNIFFSLSRFIVGSNFINQVVFRKVFFYTFHFFRFFELILKYVPSLELFT